jgi:transcriptional repressor NrdR
MVCIYCGSETKVGNSRWQKRNNQVWRRRQCKKCKAVFTTHEAVDLSSTLLVQVNGSPKPFVSDILFTEILLAMQDRKDCYLAAREATATIVSKLLKLPGKPLFSTTQISLISADVLKKLDKRSYERFSIEHPSLQKR